MGSVILTAAAVDDSVNARPDQSEHVSRSLWARYGKRPFDIIVSLVLIIVLSPVLLLAALAVKLTSPGPLFFRQERTGKDGVPFSPPKFRTMRADHKHDITEIVPLGHTAITPAGRWLRRLKIDELPQLFCVLRGDMSLIGPRPTIPEQTRAYDDYQWRRQLVRPGVTGLAQVNSAANRSWEERIHYDVYYVAHHNVLMDMAILAKTLPVILLGEERFARPFSQSPYGRQKMKTAVATRTDER
jgi:lipopolysaccharide/colanic/teichoic acid biosynthesis glycosyltransferase